MNTLSELIKNSSKNGLSETLIDEVRYNYTLIVNDGSFGVHNIKYVKDLINYSTDRLNDTSRTDTN
mgnify:FL=1